jgi:hypothetical protein
MLRESWLVDVGVLIGALAGAREEATFGPHSTPKLLLKEALRESNSLTAASISP